MALDLQSLISGFSMDTVILLSVYGALAGLYLLVVPLGLFLWMNRRWHRMSNVERLTIYGLVFLFFPGMVLFVPFLNVRLSGQGEV